MKEGLDIYTVNDWQIFGRNVFRPPLKVSFELINEARIVHVVQGTSLLYSANQFLSLQAGDTVLMKPDLFINDWRANEDEQLNQVIVFNLSAEFLQHLYQNQLPEWLSSKSQDQPVPLYKPEAHPLLTSYFSTLRQYLDHPKIISEEMIQLKVKEILMVLIQTDYSGDARKLLSALFSASAYDFQGIIQTHLFEDLKIEDLAFLAGMSLSSFKRKFQAAFGTSPTRYIVQKRLDRAKALLSTTDMRISEIAYDCGFNDLGYFSKTFRSHIGFSPSEFREHL